MTEMSTRWDPVAPERVTLAVEIEAHDRAVVMAALQDVASDLGERWGENVGPITITVNA